MANANKPSGLAPVQYSKGNPWSGQARTYYIAQADTNAYAIGDVVKSATGAAAGDGNGVPGVTIGVAGASNILRGVIVGIGRTESAVMANWASLDTNTIPATKTFPWYVLVVDDPDVIFEVQEDTTSASPLTAAAIGQTANLSSGANNGFLSQWQMNNNSVSTAATGQLRLWGLARRADNAFGTNAKWLVTINQHELQLGGVGV